MSQAYKFRRGDQVVIVSGSHKGAMGMVESLVSQRTVDYPNDDYAAGYHVRCLLLQLLVEPYIDTRTQFIDYWGVL